MSPSPLSFLSLLFLLLNGTVQSNTCSTEGFMEISLLETKQQCTNCWTSRISIQQDGSSLKEIRSSLVVALH